MRGGNGLPRVRVRDWACPITVALWLIALLSAAGEVEVRAEPSETYHYYFFDRSRRLTLDTSRIALRAQQGSPTERSSNQKPLPIAGWTIVSLPEDSQTDTGSRRTVTRLTQRGEVEFASPVFIGDDGGEIIITPELLIAFQPQVSPQDAEAILSDATVLERHWAGMRGAFRVRYGSRDGFAVLDAANALADRPEVLYAEPDVIFTGSGGLLPNDPLFPMSWGLHNKGQSGGVFDADMDAPEAWDLSVGQPAIIIAILDTGVQLDHPDLHVMPGTDSTSDGPGQGGPVNGFDNHGTLIAGTVSAHIGNGLGTTGIAPQCRSASARTFIATDEEGHWISQPSWTVNSLAWAESIGARVTNNSNAYGFTSSAIAQKYAQTRDAGMIHFASVHNDSAAQITYPSSLPSVNALAALTRAGERASYSNYGPGLDFSAPGDEIVSTDRTGGNGYVPGDYIIGFGTSFASPFAAGTAGLVLARNPGLHPQAVEHILQDTCIDLSEAGYDTDYGWGFVNAHQAVLAADPSMRGACCMLDGCVELLTALECQDAGGGQPGGRWFVNRPCAQVQCPPAHTRCASAIDIAVPGTVTLDNSHLTSLPNPPYSCGTEGFHDGTLWLRFTAADTSVRINTCRSKAKDSTLAVYDACGAAAAIVACSEDDQKCPADPFLGDQCIRNLESGQEYFIQFSAWSSGDRGSYTIELQSPCPPPSPLADPAAIIKNRSLSLSVPAASTTANVEPTALRVTLVELQNPVPPNAPQFPPQDFSAFEGGTTCDDPLGCVRWVGPPKTYTEDSHPLSATFRAARVQCTPFYHDWSSEGVFFVNGAEIMPSSTYDVHNIAATCSGNEANCTNVGSALRVTTGRYGDVRAPFNPPDNSPQPDGVDVSSLVNKFKGLPGAPSKTAAQLQPNVPDPNVSVDALDIAASVDAFKGFRYPFDGPCVCPSTVVCNAVACSGAAACGGGRCIRICAGGLWSGFHCQSQDDCSGGACGPGFCRDACARCRP